MCRYVYLIYLGIFGYLWECFGMFWYLYFKYVWVSKGILLDVVFGFGMLFSMLNMLNHHLWVTFPKTTLFQEGPFSMVN